MGVDATVYKIRFEAIPADDDWSDYEALHARIGNAATVAHLAVLIEGLPDGLARFPLILTRVLYSGTHAGDQIEAHDVGALRQEAQGLPEDLSEDAAEGGHLARFRKQLLALCDAALTHATPIYF
jgi:hypothetical protein